MTREEIEKFARKYSASKKTLNMYPHIQKRIEGDYMAGAVECGIELLQNILTMSSEEKEKLLNELTSSKFY
jgi:hypothetical protein